MQASLLNMARPRRFERLTARFVAEYSIQLSYGRVFAVGDSNKIRYLLNRYFIYFTGIFMCAYFSARVATARNNVGATKTSKVSFSWC
jgi:hypothetical protein